MKNQKLDKGINALIIAVLIVILSLIFLAFCFSILAITDYILT